LNPEVQRELAPEGDQPSADDQATAKLLDTDVSRVSRAIHPVADIFPMLTEDELAELAADIADRGLLHPIVLDTEGRVLDGRNRSAACRIAGVEPRFETYTGDDPDGYALAANGQRRDMSKSRKAMVAARSLLVTNNSMSANAAAKAIGVSQSLMAKAVVVLNHVPELVDDVIAGTTPLDEVYRIARSRKAPGLDEDRDETADDVIREFGATYPKEKPAAIKLVDRLSKPDSRGLSGILELAGGAGGAVTSVLIQPSTFPSYWHVGIMWSAGLDSGGMSVYSIKPMKPELVPWMLMHNGVHPASIEWDVHECPPVDQSLYALGSPAWPSPLLWAKPEPVDVEPIELNELRSGGS
jgi:hypothetical protein